MAYFTGLVPQDGAHQANLRSAFQDANAGIYTARIKNKIIVCYHDQLGIG
jgi:hypothetical protein